ncbi:disulfide bond formation protein B [Gymnodinialimonas hymeniacidonis]|uniref:disulfide bond formation protein B n=1 Tax=Gymnodinialimonas hymeniacidonis TaxID=3126508 RepID=UPI0034C6756A
MTLTRRHLIAVAGLGSFGLFLGALYFQYVVGLLPCTMCLWQRWPHRVAIVLSVIGVAIPNAIIALLGAVTALVGAGLALLHTGVEREWWDGPQVCGASAAQDVGALTPEQLFDTTSGPQLVLCNEVAWEFLGLSMASWNGLICLGLAVIWLMAARRPA